MKLLDLLALVLENLGRRKARVGLTAVGVVIGTAAVVVLMSLAIGLQRSATEQLSGIGDLTQIQVFPNYGEGGGGGGPGVVIRSGGGAASGGQSLTQKLLTNKSLTEFSGLPGVLTVIPRDNLQANLTLSAGGLLGSSQIIGLGGNSLSTLGLEAQAGTLTLATGTAVIGAMVPTQFYDPRQRPGQPPPTPPDLLGKAIKITLSKTAPDGVEIRKSAQLRVVGILAETRGEPDYSIYMRLEEVAGFNEWSLGRRVNRNRDGYSMAIVKVADVKQALDVTDQIKALGYQAFTPQEFVQGITGFFIVLQVIFGGVGAIALLVAAIGIANTMTMAILERTREIGLMKAVGATNRDVLSVFLGEAAGIGFLGGAGGVAVGWGAAKLLNAVAIAFFASQAAQSGGPTPSVAVYTPLWLSIFALVFATTIGLLSGLYPALRAATLVPVAALKYE